MDNAGLVECAASKWMRKQPGGHVCSILRRARLPPPSLQKDEGASLKALRVDKNITILPTGKGNPTVIMDVAQHEKRI